MKDQISQTCKKQTGLTYIPIFFIIYIFGQQTEWHKFPDRMAVGIPWIQFAFNFFRNAILIYWSCKTNSPACFIFKFFDKGWDDKRRWTEYMSLKLHIFEFCSKRPRLALGHTLPTIQYLPAVKRQKREAHHSHPSSPSSRMSGSIPLLLLHALMAYTGKITVLFSPLLQILARNI